MGIFGAVAAAIPVRACMQDFKPLQPYYCCCDLQEVPESNFVRTIRVRPTSGNRIGAEF